MNSVHAISTEQLFQIVRQCCGAGILIGLTIGLAFSIGCDCGTILVRSALMKRKLRWLELHDASYRAWVLQDANIETALHPIDSEVC